MFQTHLQWTPDGEYIIFRSNRTDGQYDDISMKNYEIIQIITGDSNSEIHLGWKTNKGYQFRLNKLITPVQRKSL